MKPALILKSVRNLRNVVATNINRARDREFIPKSAISLGIETSSLCNLECRFCAYVKKQSPKVSMKDEFFRNAIAQAIEMGYRRFDLTPCTGDVFMDRGVFNKLEHMESHPDVLSYSFFTNFTTLAGTSPPMWWRIFRLCASRRPVMTGSRCWGAAAVPGPKN